MQDRTAAHHNTHDHQHMMREITPVLMGTSELYRRLTEGGESFSSVVQGPYAAHDLTRDDIRSLLSRGLHETQGNYTHLVRLFNMDAGACRWMVNFVRKDCQPASDSRTGATVARFSGSSY